MRAAAATVLFVFALAPIASKAQNTVAPSQVTPPPFDALKRAPRVGPLAVPAIAGPSVPDDAAALFFRLGDIAVDGEFDALTASRKELVGPYRNRTISVADLFAIAQALEKLYVGAGYILARVIVPEQEIVDGGTARLRILDGYVERIDTTGLPAHVQQLVLSRLQPIVGTRRVKLADIERRLLLAGEVAGVTLQSSLSPGDEVGGTVLHIDGKYAPVNGVASANNFNPKSLGTWQLSLMGFANSLTGLGERTFAAVTSSSHLGEITDDDPMLRIATLGLSIPIGIDGLLLSFEHAYSNVHPTARPGALDRRGVLRRISARADYPLIKTRSAELRLSAELDYSDQRSNSDLFGPESKDEYTALRTGAQAVMLTPWQTPLFASIQFSRGLGGRDSSDAAADGVKLFRQGSEPTFSKLAFKLSHIQPIPSLGLQLDAYAAGQTGFGAAMLLSEQFLLNGTTAVGGLPPGVLFADSGVSGRLELVSPGAWQLPLLDLNLSPYVFVAAGIGSLEMPTAVENSTVRGRSFGGGVRLELGSFYDLNGPSSLAVELARQESTDTDDLANTRLSVSIFSRF